MTVYVEEPGEFGQRGDPVPVSVTVLRNQGQVSFTGSSDRTTVNVTVAPGTVIFTATAANPDTQAPFDVITYSLLGSPEAEDYFRIDKVMGEVTVVKALTNVTATSFALRLQAEDGGGLLATRAAMLLTVEVRHNLATPRLRNASYAASLREDLPLATSVLTVQASDDDIRAPYNTLVFALTGDTATMEFFALDADEGTLTIKRDLREATSDVFSGTVRVCDGGTPPLCSADLVSLSIDVIRNRNTPQFPGAPYNVSLPRLQNGSPVTSVSATDPDSTTSPFGRITYSVIGDDEAPDVFEIDPTTGEIGVKSVPTSVSSPYKIRVQACDGGNMCNTTVVTVNVRTNSQAPQFIPLPANYRAAVLETVTLGEVILKLNATDADVTPPNNVVSFAITEGPDVQECFQIDSATGELSAKRSLRVAPCTANVFNLRIVATDGGGLSATATATVSVQRNLNRPELLQQNYTQTILENQALSTSIIRVSAQDRDLTSPHRDLQFRIVGNQQAQQYFSINNNGEVVLIRSPADDPTIPSFTLEVEVSDQGNPPLTADRNAFVTVNVLRNNTPPIFFNTTYKITIEESLQIGSNIILVTAQDADTTDALVYTLTGDEQAQQFYAIEPGTGAVTLTRSLAEGTQMFDVLTVEVTDSGAPPNKDWTVVHITIERDSPGTCVTSSPPPGALPTGASIGIGIAIGIVICALIAAIAYLLLRGRVSNPKEHATSSDANVHYDNVGQQPAAEQAAREEEGHYIGLQQETRDVPRGPSDYATLNSISGHYESLQQDLKDAPRDPSDYAALNTTNVQNTEM